MEALKMYPRPPIQMDPFLYPMKKYPPSMNPGKGNIGKAELNSDAGQLGGKFIFNDRNEMKIDPSMLKAGDGKIDFKFKVG